MILTIGLFLNNKFTLYFLHSIKRSHSSMTLSARCLWKDYNQSTSALLYSVSLFCLFCRSQPIWNVFALSFIVAWDSSRNRTTWRWTSGQGAWGAQPRGRSWPPPPPQRLQQRREQWGVWQEPPLSWSCPPPPLETNCLQ